MRHGNRWGRLCLSAVVGGTLVAQTKVDLGTQSRNIDFSGANFTKPFKSGTVLPASCTVGETYFKTNATAGQNLYGCVATNTWLVLSGASATLPAVSGQSGKILSNNGSATDWRAFGGDVSGDPDALAVSRLQGRIVSGGAPANGQALVWNASASQWEPGTVSGGGGSSTGAQLAAADYTPSRTSNTVLTLPSVPAVTFRVGTAACANAVDSATVTINGGTGTVWIGLGGDCMVKVRHNVVAACAAGCTAISGASGFDTSDLPLYEWTVSMGALAASGTRRLTPYSSVPLAAGANITLTTSGGVTTINALSSGSGESLIYEQEEFWDTGCVTGSPLFKLRWRQDSSAGGDSIVCGAGATANHPGVATHSTAAAVNADVAVRAGAYLVLGQRFTARFLVKPSHADSSSGYRAQIGDRLSFNADGDSGVAIEKLPADTQWFAVCRVGGMATRTALGPVSANWTAFQMRRIDGSSFGFKFAASLAGLSTAGETAIATNCPDAANAINGFPAMQAITTAAASRSLQSDYFDLSITEITR